MRPLRTSPTVPREVIPVTTYEQLNRYLAKFCTEELGLVLLLGRPGTGKSENDGDERKRERARDQ